MDGLMPPSAFTSPPPKSIKSSLITPDQLKASVVSKETHSLSSDKATDSPHLTRQNVSCQAPISEEWMAHRTQTAELERLRMENYRLMEENIRRTVEMSQASPQVHSSHLENLVERMSNEIQQLKSKLREAEQNSIRNSSEHEAEVREQKQQYERKVNQLKANATETEQKMQNEMSEILQSCQDEKSKMTEKVDLLLAQLKGKESELAVVTAEAKEDRKKMDDRQIRISDLTAMLTAREETIASLRSYSQSIQDSKAEGARWPITKTQLESRIQQLQRDSLTLLTRDQLSQENSALNMRVTAVQEILAAQEAGLKQATCDDKQRKQLSLLSKWRQKVYQLLVQQQSSDLTVRADLRKWEEIKGSLTGQVSDLRSRVVELESTVKEREAQISLLRNHIQFAEDKILETNNQLLESIKSKTIAEKACHNMAESVKRTQSILEVMLNLNGEPETLSKLQ